MSNAITMFLCGDVMTGRGVDQVLPYPSQWRIHEPFLLMLRKHLMRSVRGQGRFMGFHLIRCFARTGCGKNARGYVRLAEDLHGPIPKPAAFHYIWGDASEELDRVAPDVRIINLETSITTSDDYWKKKRFQYRMHPKNVPCLTAAKIDCCALANNHVLDWGYSGLEETLKTLHRAGINTAGAGRNRQEAEAPAIMDVPGKGRVIVFAFGLQSSFIPPEWAASDGQPGVNLLADLSDTTVRYICERIQEVKRPGDVVVAPIHWGANWEYQIPSDQRAFAHKLIDEAAVDIIHGHSSHHVKGIEVYRDRPILYGCGDFLNDYENNNEGVSRYEDFRHSLGLMYFPSMNPSTGRLVQFRMTPTQVRGIKVMRPSPVDALWLRDTLNRESKRFGTRVELRKPDDSLELHWRQL
jgi:poly-gamma-glutamate synthesis protein (capsule biosynthesis protein)